MTVFLPNHVEISSGAYGHNNAKLAWRVRKSSKISKSPNFKITFLYYFCVFYPTINHVSSFYTFSHLFYHPTFKILQLGLLKELYKFEKNLGLQREFRHGLGESLSFYHNWSDINKLYAILFINNKSIYHGENNYFLINTFRIITTETMSQ